MMYIAVVLVSLFQIIYGSLNCDSVEYKLGNLSIVQAAGVCQTDGSGGSMMLTCESNTKMNQEMYDSNPYCNGNPDYTFEITQVFSMEGVTDYTITCCTGNPCQFGNATIYETDDCDAAVSPQANAIQISVIGSCMGSSDISVEYTRCSNQQIEANMYFESDCSGDIVAEKMLSNGDCNATEGMKYEISCDYAINTCSNVITTPTPTACVCDSYTADNSSWILPDGNGCTYGCNGCMGNVCECYDKETCDSWNDIADLVSGLSTILIVLIIAGSVCGLCIIGLIVYCVCAGALCCAAAARPRKGVVSFQQMADNAGPDPINLIETAKA